MLADNQYWFFGDPEASNQTLRSLGIDEMTGAEFEEFVAELMKQTGFDVDHVGGPGDLGADLVARSGDLSLTVQVKRYGPDGSVSGRAVSDAVAAREHYEVGSAAVVTNRSFSGDARKFAQGRCFLIARSFLGSWAATHRESLAGGARETVLDGFTGAEFESFLADLLRARGHGVEETGGSGDFGVDLIAQDADGEIAIQAKRHSREVSRRAVSDAVSGADYYGCDRAWVVTTAPGFTAGASTLAESTGTRLVGREEIFSWIEDAEIQLPTERTSSPNLENPEAVADRLRWSDQLAGAELEQPVLELKSGEFATALAAFFLRRVKGRMRLPYKGIPEGTWLCIRLPNHSLLSWSAVGHRAISIGNVFARPLQSGSGIVRYELTASLPSGEGVQEGLQTIQNAIQTATSNRIELAFWSEEPSREALANFGERAKSPSPSSSSNQSVRPNHFLVKLTSLCLRDTADRVQIMTF